MRTVTCTTAGCENESVPIDIPDAAEGEIGVVCGVCSQYIIGGPQA